DEGERCFQARYVNDQVGRFAEIVALDDGAGHFMRCGRIIPQDTKPLGTYAECRRVVIADEGRRSFGSHPAKPQRIDGQRGMVLLHDPAPYEVHAAKEIRDLPVYRSLVYVLGRIDLRYPDR